MVTNNEKERVASLKKEAEKLKTDDWRSNPAVRNLNADGQEIMAGRSLSVTAYLPSLGDRIKRYMRTPQLEADKFNNPEYWDADDYEAVFDENDRPRVSIHDELYQAGLAKAKVRYDERKKLETSERQKALDEANAEFKLRVKEIMQETALAQNPPKG